VTKRRRGRPRKLDAKCDVNPEILQEAIKQVKKIGKEYSEGDLQAEVFYLETSRPRLLKNAGVNNENYESTGKIEYDQQRVSCMPEDDQHIISCYLSAKAKIHFLKHSVADITDIRLRQTANDALLLGWSCSKMANVYGISERAVYKRKKKALADIARTYIARKTTFF